MDMWVHLRRAALVAAASALALLASATPASAASLLTDRAVLSTDHIGKGGVVTVTASGFAPNSPVQVLNGLATDRFGDVFGTELRADATGTVRAVVGKNLRRGTYRVRVNGLTPTNELRSVSGVYTAQNDTCSAEQCAQADLPSTGGSTPLLLVGGLLIVGLVGRRLLIGHGREAAAIVTVVALGAALSLQNPPRADAASLATLSGTVKSLAGRGLGGVCVHASNERAFGSARTDASGRYSIRSLSPGTYAVTAVDCNASTLLMGKSVGALTLGGGGTTQRVIALARGGVLAGRVVDARNGGGVAGNCLHLAAGRSFGGRCALASGAGGVFVSEPLAAGSYGVAFQDLTGRYALQYLAPRANVRSGHVYLAQASAQAATTVSGTVVDDDTDNAPSWQICALLLSNDQPTMMSAVTGQDGTYSIEGVGAGTYKVKFSDCSGNTPAYETQYYNQKATIEAADPVAVSDGQARTGIDARMSKSDSTTSTTTTTVPTTSTTSTTLVTTTTSAPSTTTAPTTTTTTPAANTPVRKTPTVPTVATGTTTTPGGTVTVTGEGFKPGSAVTGALFSTPVALGTKNADANGRVTFDVKVPANFELGTHEIQLQGVDAQNATRVLSVTIQVAGRLVRTGSETNTLLPAGAALFLLGAIGMFLGRRRMLGAHYRRS